MGYFGNAFIPNRGHGQRGNLRVPRYVLREVMLEQIHRNNEDFMRNEDCNNYDENRYHFENEKNGNSKTTKKKMVTFHWAKKLIRFEHCSSNLNNDEKKEINEKKEDKKFTLWFDNGFIFPNVDL